MVKEFSLNKQKMPAFLDELRKNAGNSPVSIYLPSGMAVRDIQKSLITSGMEQYPEKLPETAADSKTGAAIFRNDSGIYMVLPPFPIKEMITFAYCETGPIVNLLTTEYKIGIVLVHLGSYGVGYCTGEALVSSKVGTGLVHGRTRKGGSSQQRFQRRRENQANEFLDRVCKHAAEHLVTHEKELDYIAYGGPRQTVLSLKKRCPFLQSLEECELPVIDVPVIRQPVLEKAVSRIWSSRIIEWRDE